MKNAFFNFTIVIFAELKNIILLDKKVRKKYSENTKLVTKS